MGKINLNFGRIVVVLLFALCAVADVYLFKLTTACRDSLQSYEASSSQKMQAIDGKLTELKAKLETLDSGLSGLKENVQVLSVVLKNKSDLLAQLQKELETSTGQVKAVQDTAGKLDTAVKQWQADYLKTLTGLEDKLNITDKDLRGKIDAIVVTKPNPNPTPAPAPKGKNK